MGFLTPLFLAALAAAAIPIAIHLIQRERKNVVAFPSLMFLRKIPYESVRRRKIHNWALLLLRLAAIILIVAAFARPFFRGTEASTEAAGGAREVVLLIDQSFSMGYGDRWQRATAAAGELLAGLGPLDRASLIFFAAGADVAVRSASDRARLESALAAAGPGAGATRYAPALKLAGSLLAESSLPRREAVMISDFQRSGWQGAEGLRLPDGATLTTVAIQDAATPNLSVTPVVLQRARFEGQDRMTISGGVLNHGPAPVRGVEVTLEIGGRAVQRQRVDVEPRASATVTFDPFTLDAGVSRAVVRLPSDALEADNAFHFTLAPREAVRIVIVDRPGSPRDSSLYLTQALAVGDTPPFETILRTPETVSAEDVRRASVVILNDAAVPPVLATRLAGFVEGGGGLLVALGDRASWSGASGLLPALPGAPVDRTRGTPARLGGLEYGHEIFEPFRAPRSGDFSAAHIYGYRAVTMAPEGRVLARFDDGAPALIERRAGGGRVLVWASTLDTRWSDLPLKAIYLPFVHRLVTSLAGWSEPPAWRTVGEVLDSGGIAAGEAGPVVLAPSGQRLVLGREGPDVVVLAEPGFYEVRAAGREAESLMTVAANVDLAESDLTPMDPQDVRAAAMGHAGGPADAGLTEALRLSDSDRERAQRVWWYLLFAGIVLLGLETVMANRLSRSRA